MNENNTNPSHEEIACSLGYNLAVQPINYTLKITVDHENDLFSGFVSIEMEFKEQVDSFMINAEELEIISVNLDNKPVEHSSKTVGNMDIFCPTTTSGIHIADIAFKAPFNTKASGFYLSKYGENQKLYSTQFEPVDARKAFPCFDHPMMKATFDIIVQADKKFTVLSNMPVSKVEEDPTSPDSRITNFERMPKTATYLIAWVIGKLDKISLGRVSLYSTYSIENGWFSLHLADRTLKIFEKYFEIPFPLEKIDLVAIPEYANHAMENWGLITFKETSLLFDKTKSSMSERARIAITVTHELAHQWFGNLVTPVWWDDLWLNEGFATWASYLGCEALRQCEMDPNYYESNRTNDKSDDWYNQKLIDWDPWLTFITNDFNRGLEMDVLVASHPIKVPVLHPNEISQIFDPISYCKGASIIRMVEKHLGPEVFRKKLAEYLKFYAWSNATSDNLFEKLSDEKNDIKSLMNIWAKKVGFPIVKLKGTEVTQSRMLLNPDQSEDKFSWPILMNVKLLDCPDIPESVKISNFKERSYDISNELPRASSCLLLNHGGYGFYRSKYEINSSIYNMIETMSPIDKLVFVYDQVALAMPFKFPLDAMLSICMKFKNEIIPDVLEAVFRFLSELKQVLWDGNTEVVKTIFEMLEGRTDFDLKEEKDLDTMKLRVSILSMAISQDLKIKIPKDCHPMYLRYYYIQDFQKVNDFKIYLDLYKKSTSETQILILNAMAMTKDEDIYVETIKLLLSDQIKQQDKKNLTLYALSNSNFKNRLISFFEDNFDELRENLPYFVMMYIVESVCSWTEDVEIFQEKMQKRNILEHYGQWYNMGIEKAKFRNAYREYCRTKTIQSV